MEEYGVPIERVINGGGIPQKNEVLNQVYANILGKHDSGAEQEGDESGVGDFCFLRGEGI